MAIRRTVLAALVAVFALAASQPRAEDPVWGAPGPGGQRPSATGSPAGVRKPADAWLERMERWFAAVGRHVPGRRDEAVDSLASWTADDLDALMRDVSSLVAEVSRTPVSAGIPAERLAIKSRGRLVPPSVIDALTRGTGPEGGVNGFLVRAALLHADVALLGPPGRLSPNQVGLLQALDGQSVGFRPPTTHLSRARALLDLVRPSPSQDQMARKWYLAIAAWLHSEQRLGDESSHLLRAAAVFPSDADITFMVGCLHETLASPLVQGVIERAPVPRSSIQVRVPSDEISQAEAAFRRVLTARPDMTEARLRRARVLGTQGKHRDAAAELQQAVTSTRDPLMLYFGHLFLGAEEESLGHLAAARVAYARAGAIYPGAQSPYLALSHLARASGDTQAALRSVQDLLELRNVEAARIDPWWSYHEACGPDASRLLAELRQPFLAPHGN